MMQLSWWTGARSLGLVSAAMRRAPMQHDGGLIADALECVQRVGLADVPGGHPPGVDVILVNQPGRTIPDAGGAEGRDLAGGVGLLPQGGHGRFVTDMAREAGPSGE